MSNKITEQIISSKIFSEWHWLSYHFHGLPYGKYTELSFDFINRISFIDLKIPGFSEETINRLASISGKEKYEPHYEQIIQLLVEVVIFYRIIEGFLVQDVGFIWEPTTKSSNKNPELLIEHSEWKNLIEIKCPSIFKHLRNAAKNDTQLGARLGDIKIFDDIAHSGEATRPLDNKIKDYLISANEKFSPFKSENSDISSILIIAWSQHLFEATSPLINGMSGLFTDNSFYKDANNHGVKFNSIDGVLVTEHLELILRATREEPLPYGYQQPLDYGAFKMQGFLPPAYIANPYGSNIHNQQVLTELGAVDINEIQDPRVSPLDYVMWLPRR